MGFVDILDLLMCRYGDLNYFSKLPLKLGNKIILKALDEREKERAWDVWLALYPKMSKDNFISFSEFCDNKLKPEAEAKKSSLKILKESEYIRQKVTNGEIAKVIKGGS